MIPADLLRTTREWIDDDPDPDTRAAGEALLASGDEAAVRDHFGRRLEFGTAGLRARVGPGPNRMNRAIVRRTTAGFAAYLLRETPDARSRGVVVGYDGRHGSREFAADAASVLAGREIPVFLYDAPVPTPQVGHAVNALGAAGGIVVTASHNPPQDNGYKVFWGNAAQIIPPHDAGISAAIDAVGRLADQACPALEEARAAGLVRPVDGAVLQQYLDAVEALRVHHAVGLRIVYTPMHGVGRDLVERVLRRAGHTDLHVVPEQAEPDGDFPTVSFPNPEEPGALDLAIALAKRVGADLIIANDPDADRLAVAVPDGTGGFEALSGNQIGVLLAEDLLSHGPKVDGRLVVTTVVSSTMLSRIAAAHGVEYAATLTGFKWLADRAIARDAAGGQFVLGYEEALGYSAGSVVRDKDGISAALLFCDLAAWCKAEGRTLAEHLDGLYRRYGLHLGRQKSVVLPGEAGAAKIRGLMETLRAAPPERIGHVAVERVLDYLPGAAGLPPSNLIAFDLADGSRVLARPSGTEPKIKFYFEVRESMAGDEPLAEAERRARARLEHLVSSLSERLGV